MAKTVFHRSYGKLILRYDDGYENTFYDKERIRWLLNEADSIVSFYRYVPGSKTNGHSRKTQKNV